MNKLTKNIEFDSLELSLHSQSRLEIYIRPSRGSRINDKIPVHPSKISCDLDSDISKRLYQVVKEFFLENDIEKIALKGCQSDIIYDEQRKRRCAENINNITNLKTLLFSKNKEGK